MPSLLMVQKTASRDLDKFIVRFPDGMRDQIAEAAKANKRTMNQEVIARLEATFAMGIVTHESGFDAPSSPIGDTIEERLAALEGKIDKLLER